MAATATLSPSFAAHPDPRLRELQARALAEEGVRTPAGYRALAFGRAMRGDEPLIVARARILVELVALFPPLIRPPERIVGHHLFGQGNGETDQVDFPDLMGLPAERRQALLAETALTPAQQRIALRGAGRWAERQRAIEATPDFPHDSPAIRQDTESCVYHGGGWCTNHSVRGYERVLREGFVGIAEEVRGAEGRGGALGARGRAPLRGEPGARGRAPLRGEEEGEGGEPARLAFLIAAQAGARLGLRFAAAARRQARGCDDPAWRRELGQIEAVCRQVPAHPARTLREAVQSLLFAHLLTCAEDHINANSIGRIDQLLGRYYDADLAAGRISREEALQLIEELWLKLYQTYDVQQTMVGGCDGAGRDATNEVSHLCLEAAERLGQIRCLSVRLHRGSPRPLVERAARLVQRGGGIPFFFNDEVIVPALVEKGVRPADARDYAAIGCVEITIPGKTNPHAVSHNLNLAKVLEVTLHGGLDPRTGRQIGPRTRPLDRLADFEELAAAYRRQLAHFARHAAALSNNGERRQERLQPLPYQSILTDRCIARGKDITAGGARYNYHSCSAIGIPNVADSLCAIRQVVFGKGLVSAKELLAALAADFEGYEPLRQALLRAPKYGNDLDEVDGLAAEVAGQYCRLMHGLRTVHGGRFHVHLFSFVWHVDPFGKTTGALPDGRRAGEPLAYSLSPSQGRDQAGLTAMLRSLAKIPHHLAAGSSSAIIEIDPTLFRGAAAGKLADVLMASIAQGIGQLQINVVDADTLRQAQANPERYQSLCVRVSGYSYRFCLLGKDMQEHIIARVKHRA